MFPSFPTRNVGLEIEMPFKAPRICACGKKVPAGIKCECQKATKRASDKIYDAKRPNARQRGYDKEWERAAKRFLSCSENRACVICGELATVVDHRIAFKGDDALRMDVQNWQPMCRPCNSRKNVRREGGFGRKPKGAE